MCNNVIIYFRADDDINDVAAMGGVNLAEESQRILGSTEFVGTQIRSCKDEVFLHMTPLQQRIKQIGNFISIFTTLNEYELVLLTICYFSIQSWTRRTQSRSSSIDLACCSRKVKELSRKISSHHGT